MIFHPKFRIPNLPNLPNVSISKQSLFSPFIVYFPAIPRKVFPWRQKNIFLLRYSLLSLVLLLIVIGGVQFIFDRKLSVSQAYPVWRGITKSLGFQITDIQIQGLYRLTPEEISQAITGNENIALIGQATVDFDTELATHRLVELSLVESASVKVHLPGVIAINIQERQEPEEHALYQEDGKSTVITDTGERLSEVPTDLQAGLLIIFGLNAPEHVGNLIKVLKVHKIYQYVQSATWVGDRRWDILVNQIVIKLSEDPKELDENLQNIFELQETYSILEKDIDSIDMRVSGQIIITSHREDYIIHTKGLVASPQSF